jgi:hypothetical protein
LKLCEPLMADRDWAEKTLGVSEKLSKEDRQRILMFALSVKEFVAFASKVIGELRCNRDAFAFARIHGLIGIEELERANESLNRRNKTQLEWIVNLEERWREQRNQIIALTRKLKRLERKYGVKPVKKVKK